MLCPRCLRANDEEGEVFHCPACSYECRWPEAIGTQPLLRWRVAETRGTPSLPATCDYCNGSNCSPVRVDWQSKKAGWPAATEMVGLLTTQAKVTRCTGLYMLCKRCARAELGQPRYVKTLIILASVLLCVLSLGGFAFLTAGHLPPDVVQSHPLMSLLAFGILCFPGLIPAHLTRPDTNFPTPFPQKQGFHQESATRWTPPA